MIGKQPLLLSFIKYPTCINWKQFRSVSLCCTFYKVVARILVESQRCDCIVHLASPEQATFAPDRSILNIIPYVQELTTLTKWPLKRVVLYGRA